MGAKGVFQAMEEAGRWLQDGGGAPAYHCQAMAYLASDLPVDAALRFLESAREPDVADDILLAKIYQQAGDAWTVAENYTSALEAYQVASDLNPNNPEFWLARAQSLYMLEDIDGAHKDLSQLFALKPDHSGAFVLKAKLELDSKDFHNAWLSVHKALEISPFETDILLVRGQVAEQMRINNIDIPKLKVAPVEKKEHPQLRGPISHIRSRKS